MSAGWCHTLALLNQTMFHRALSVSLFFVPSLQCLYCEKTFRDKTTLKDHMRKKQHRRINGNNSEYDCFYIINYLVRSVLCESIIHINAYCHIWPENILFSHLIKGHQIMIKWWRLVYFPCDRSWGKHGKRSNLRMIGRWRMKMSKDCPSDTVIVVWDGQTVG